MKLRQAVYKLVTDGGFIRNSIHPRWLTLDEDGSLVYADTLELVVTTVHADDILSPHWQWTAQVEQAPTRPKLRLVVGGK